MQLSQKKKKKNPDQLKSVKGRLSTKKQLIKGKIMITQLKETLKKKKWEWVLTVL